MELPFERQAMKDEPIPKGLSSADTKAYISLVQVYKMFGLKMIGKTQAKQMKESVVAAWTTEKSKETFLEDRVSTLSGRIQSATETYLANKTIENADELVRAFYNGDYVK